MRAMSALVIESAVLDQAGAFFEERGVDGAEGTALIAGVPGAAAHRLVIPDQQAGRYPRCWVRITPKGELDVASALARAERYVARIHSHPGEACHSAVDDENPILTHQGALSVVVPFFGLGLRRGLDSCAVFCLDGTQWVELGPGPQRDAVVAIR